MEFKSRLVECIGTSGKLLLALSEVEALEIYEFLILEYVRLDLGISEIN